ncbi:MAG: substrate-binding domain-containing protein [Kiritimatiellae bacterium]|nr:substrate-binding domain-containing protein [Kiritimatiellia bacterium]
METVLFITDLHTGAHVLELAGVFERAAVHGWRVIEVERDRASQPLAESFKTWNPAGCIMECGKLTDAIDTSAFANVPIVYIDPDRKTIARGANCVTNDASAIAGRAADELMKLDNASYAYVAWRAPTPWSVSRGEAFMRIMRAGNKRFHLYDKPWQDTCQIQKDLARWLKPLPRPIGIFAANDHVAEQVAGACQLAGLESPRDAAIIGVDNDELACENCVPTLSSIEPDFKEAGRLAADLLAEILANPAQKPKHLHFGPVALHRRQSTRSVNTGDIRIIRAVEHIRRDAVNGLTAAQIIAEIGLSRRLAEKRFLAATGRTILGEIQEMRFARVLRLLETTDLPIGQIAGLCGWESDSYLKRFFKARTGMTLREWRAKHTTPAKA